METERALARFTTGTELRAIPDEVSAVARQVLLTVCGTAVSGAAQDGIASLRDVLVTQGGRAEATALVFGDRLPASSAALLNGAMARALDYCDAMKPGLHLGSSVVPVGLATAELEGTCSGSELLTALVVGLEVGARLNLTEDMYDGFDPTGIAGLMGATATAARVLRLTEEQTLHALALAFNRCGGSFQSNIDGSLAVRLIQGWVGATAIDCARFARAGLTGPVNFLSGIYGYSHLFARDRRDAASFIEGIGSEYLLLETVFKKYPSCGLTQGATELALRLATAHGIAAADIDHVEVRLPPYAHRLVGHKFEPGSNPRVDAQFSVRYCVANAFTRGASILRHFDPDMVCDPTVAGIVGKIAVTADDALDRRGHTAVQLTVTTADGTTRTETTSTAPGFPGHPLSQQHHLQRFDDCLDYAPWAPSDEQVKSLRTTIEQLEHQSGIDTVIRALTTGSAAAAGPHMPPT